MLNPCTTRPAALAAFAAIVATAGAHAQIRITEVLVDPVGPDAGAQVVELTNDTPYPVALTGWHLAGAGVVQPLPAVSLQGAQVSRVHLGRAGTSTPADLYLPLFPVLPAAGTCTLLLGASTTDPKAVVDFVAWNGGTEHAALAVAANQWPSTLVSVRLPAGEGTTIAHLGDAAFVDEVGPDEWYADTTPTLGLPNDNGGTWNLRHGCPAADPAPWMGLARKTSRPWIGELLEVDVYNLPQTTRSAAVVLGARSVPPLPLDVFGLTGCSLLVSLDIVTPVAITSGAGLWSAHVPNAPWLVGGEVFLQAFVPWSGAPNPAQAYVSNALILRIGSR